MVKELCERFRCICVCPEMSGGLGCPREVHEIAGGSGEDILDGKARVLSLSGKVRTGHFMRGAKIALEKALQNSISVAILKRHSPSCGKNRIHAGKFDGTLRDGNGVTTALLLRHGIRVFSEDELENAAQALCASPIEK